jgi:hypothetical protein
MMAQSAWKLSRHTASSAAMIGSPRGGEEDTRGAGLGDLVGDLVAGAGAAAGVAACSSFSLAMMTEAFLGVRGW